MKIKQLTWLAAMAVLGAGVFSSAAATLKSGDTAPKLQVSKWVQGEPVKDFEAGKTYIVEFWATWCGPCRVSIPHLNEIHTKFKDKNLVVIGQDVWEKDTAKVEPFIKEMGNKMTYRVALDLVPDGADMGKMAETWLTAADANGIPTAFIVDKQGKIAWIGHPMEMTDSMIEEVLAGTFDVKKAAAEREKAGANQQELIKFSKQLDSGIKAKDWDKATVAADGIEKLLTDAQKPGLGIVRVKILMGKENYKEASKLASELSESQKDNPRLLNGLAWEMATQEGVKERDLDLAGKIALRANEATKGKEPQVLDTLARITFMQGKKEKAIEYQTEAVNLAEGQSKEMLQKTLDSYKAGQLPKAD